MNDNKLMAIAAMDLYDVSFDKLTSNVIVDVPNGSFIFNLESEDYDISPEAAELFKNVDLKSYEDKNLRDKVLGKLTLTILSNGMGN